MHIPFGYHSTYSINKWYAFHWSDESWSNCADVQDMWKHFAVLTNGLNQYKQTTMQFKMLINVKLLLNIENGKYVELNESSYLFIDR